MLDIFFIKDVMAIVVGVLMFIFNVYFGLEVLGDHSWFYLPITYATRYVLYVYRREYTSYINIGDLYYYHVAISSFTL